MNSPYSGVHSTPLFNGFQIPLRLVRVVLSSSKIPFMNIFELEVRNKISCTTHIQMNDPDGLFQSKRARLLGLVGVAILAILALVSLGRSVQFAFLTPYGGIDFHSYWYSGLFVRQQTDPFAAYLSGKEPDSPVTFIGGQGAAPPRSGPLATTPANTTPIVLLLTPFSWLPWPVANAIWYIFNLMLVLILPWLAIRWLPPMKNLGIITTALFFLAFYALKGTRAALGTGQTTLVVLTLMLLSMLIWNRSWLVSGLFLGVALSKYSIALPLFLYALYKRKFKVVVVAVLVQLFSLFLLSTWTGSDPLSILQSNYQIMKRHSNMPGIYLAELFDPGSGLRLAAPVVLTVLFLAYLIWYSYRRLRPARSTSARSFFDRHLMAALALWTLLVAYHRPYDGVLIIFFMAVVYFGFSEIGAWQLTPRQRGGLSLFVVFALAMLIVPYEQINDFLPVSFSETLLDFTAELVVLTLGGMLAVTLWLMGRVGTKG